MVVRGGGDAIEALGGPDRLANTAGDRFGQARFSLVTPHALNALIGQPQIVRLSCGA